MRLDVNALRYLQKDDFRILSALEMGMKNHDVVPTSLLCNLLKLGQNCLVQKMSNLAKHGLVKKNHTAKYEGFVLTYGGYDYLALNTFSSRNSITSVGHQIGVGKESDIYLVSVNVSDDVLAEDVNTDMVLKLERLGRTSFRTIKSNRDYIGTRKHTSWMYLSKLAAEKEWIFLNSLYKHGFPTPIPVDWNRHCIVMSYIDGILLDRFSFDSLDSSFDKTNAIEYLWATLIRLLTDLLSVGLIHGDFNEFNLIVKSSFCDDPDSYISNQCDLKKSPVVLIDFPQMVSARHENGKELFERDLNCLILFFKKRFNFEPVVHPDFEDIFSNFDANSMDLGTTLKASGYNRFKNKK